MRKSKPILATDQVYPVARFKDGSSRYVIAFQRGDSGLYTDEKRGALKLPRSEAEEHISRWHCVQAAGHYYKDVEYFDVIRAKNQTPKLNGRRRGYQRG